MQQGQQLVAAQLVAGAGGQRPAQIGQGLGIGGRALLLLADALEQRALQRRRQRGVLQALAQGIERGLGQSRQRLAHQRQIALVLQPLGQIGEALQPQALPALFTRCRQIVTEGVVVGGRGLLQLAGQLGVQAGHLGLGRAEGVGIVGQSLGLILIQLAGQLVTQRLDHLIHEVLGAAADEQTALIERELEEPEVVSGFGRLEEVHAEPGVLLQRPGVGLLLLFDAHEEIARQRAHLATHVKQLELGIGLGQEFGQGIDVRHVMVRLKEDVGDYKEAASDSQWWRARARP
ncbi:hypothetical protein D3C79_580950 [compost metagenome]